MCVEGESGVFNKYLMFKNKDLIIAGRKSRTSLRSALLRGAGALAGFGLLLGVGAVVQAAGSNSDCGTGKITVGAWTLPAWSNGLSGWACRSYDNPFTWLVVETDMKSGGYDAGFGKSYTSTKLDNISSSITVKSDITKLVTPTGAGHWWSGPKTIISTTPNYTSLDGNYECYIVETAEKSPENLIANVGGASTRVRKNDIVVGSGTYKTWTIQLGKIHQIWSIRSTYRNGGTTSVGAIQKAWRNQGLVDNYYSLGWKYNIEFTGENKGKIRFHQR